MKNRTYYDDDDDIYSPADDNDGDYYPYGCDIWNL